MLVVSDNSGTSAVAQAEYLRSVCPVTRGSTRCASLDHFIPDAEDPAGIVAALREALPARSYLALSHGTPNFHPGR